MSSSSSSLKAKCSTFFQRWRRAAAVLLVASLVCLHFSWRSVLSEREVIRLRTTLEFRQDMEEERRQREKRPVADVASNKTWVVMAVCWSSNTKFHHKSKFPYVFASTLSTRLWQLKTSHEVLVYVVYEEEGEGTAEMHGYGEGLEYEGNHVVYVPAGKTMSCSQKSQLIRLTAFQHEAIGEEDMIVTVDADVFVVDPDIFKSLETDRDRYTVWAFQHYVMEGGSNLPMCFVAMMKRDWQKYVQLETPEALVSHHAAILSNKHQWDYDQYILTRIILENGLCSTSKRNGIWGGVGLKPAAFDDSETCFRGGKEFANCYSSGHGMGYRWRGCKWWHFTPQNTEDTVLEKYEFVKRYRGPMDMETKQ